MYKKTIEENQIVVSMERKDTLQGSQKMRALGQGVRARLGKDPEGRLVVEAFLFDRNKYTEEKVDKWLTKHSDRITESLHYVQMQTPDGCFEDTTMRIQRALDDSDKFTGYVRVEFVFPDRVIVCAPEKGDMWEVPYEDTGVDIVFGDAVKISVELVKEKIAEANRKSKMRARPNMEVEGERVKLRVREAQFDFEDFRKNKEITVVIIEAGANYNKKRYYPKKTLQESAGIYAGLKMYLDHPTDAEEAEKPERSIREWLSTIRESWYEDGMVLGKVRIHSKWLAESMEDEVFRSEIGISINAAGRAYEGEIDGVRMEIMEAITRAKSVDWVTEAGARGRVLQLMESARLEQEHKEIENMDLKEFKEKHVALYNQIVKEVTEAAKGTQLTEKQIQEKIDAGVEKALNEANASAEKARKADARKAKAKEIVEGSKLPKAHQERFIETLLRETSEVADDKFESVLKESIVKEIKHLNSLGAGIKIEIEGGAAAGTQKSIVESVTKDIVEAAYPPTAKKD